MGNLFFQSRILFYLIIFLMSFTQAHASKTTWVGTLPGGVWSSASNWDNGVPTASDSAIITGGDMITNMNVLISSDALARHVTVDDHCILTIRESFTLSVTSVPLLFDRSTGIRIEKDGSFLNYGNLNISNANNGLFILGIFENFGDCTINEAADNGILLADSDDAFLSGGSGSVKNEGDLLIMNSGVALFISGISKYTNEDFMSVMDCSSGIINSGDADFQNNSRLDISNIEDVGISNRATFVNNGTLVFKNIGSSNNGIAISNFKAATVFGAFDIGNFENNSTILMSEIKGTAIRNDDSTTFLNTGTIWVQDALKYGLIGMPMSTFTMTEDGVLVLKSIGIAPLDIHEESVFEIADGGVVTISD